MPTFVAVHVGAGNHAMSDRKLLIDLCKSACTRGIRSNLDETKSIVDACVDATVVLEDSPLANAGLGSNLTSAKTVECDASLMDGCTLSFAGVAAVSCAKNPILLAREILRRQVASLSSDNCVVKSLVSPLILCGFGALEFAKTAKLTICKENELITSKTLRDYENCKNILSQSGDKTTNDCGLKNVNSEQCSFENCRYDTVGCVAVDSSGNVSASCSSGGILFKSPGRLGQAACYGCGCWAENTANRRVAVSVSGCGEYLIRTRFAQSCAEALLNRRNADDNEFACSVEIVEQFFRSEFMDSRCLRNLDANHKLAGAIIVVVDRLTDEKFCTEFVFVHNTNNMCLAYGTRCNNSDKITGIFSKSDSGRIVICGNIVK